MPAEVREEKKVEYLELVYDLIFVYIIGHAVVFSVYVWAAQICKGKSCDVPETGFADIVYLHGICYSNVVIQGKYVC